MKSAHATAAELRRLRVWLMASLPIQAVRS